MSELIPRSRLVPHGDGELAVEDWGPEDAPVVIAHHGTPSCRLDVPGIQAVVDGDVRVITFDRPGYGRSTGAPRRRVADAARHAEVVADALSVGRFATIGASGGGPHALATGALLGDRVSRVCVSVGLGPVGHNGFDPEVGMLAETVAEIRAARQGEAVLRRFVEARSDPDSGLDEWLDQLPESDQAVLARPEVAKREHEIAHEWQLHGLDGWVHDTLALFVADWGFAVSEVMQQTLLMYGESDVLVPLSHGEALHDVLPNSHLTIIPQGGHWLLDHEAHALRWLVEADPRWPESSNPARTESGQRATTIEGTLT